MTHKLKSKTYKCHTNLRKHDKLGFFAEKCLHTSGLHTAAENGVEYSSTVIAGVIKLPIILAPEVPSTVDTGSANQRLDGPKEKWDRP